MVLYPTLKLIGSVLLDGSAVVRERQNSRHHSGSKNPACNCNTMMCTLYSKNTENHDLLFKLIKALTSRHTVE